VAEGCAYLSVQVKDISPCLCPVLTGFNLLPTGYYQYEEINMTEAHEKMLHMIRPQMHAN
jgi:hypothetical protein